jgi:hypothetical protein
MPQFPQQWRSRSETDAKSSQPLAGATARAAEGDGAAGAVFSFEPDAVARAIVFHMLDEGLATSVTEDSVRRMVARLRRRGMRPAIRRAAWEVMTNHERLEWLLSETLTVPLMRADEDVVTLETRDDR